MPLRKEHIEDLEKQKGDEQRMGELAKE